MINKYVMNRNQNAKYIRSNLDNFIFHNMKLARYDVTYEDCVNGLDINTEEGKALQNFRNCYQFILDTPENEIDYSYLLDLHWILMDGLMDMINNELDNDQITYLYKMINQPTKANTEVAIDVMLYILNHKLFKDGDVRVALLFANKILLERGNGIITVPEERDEEFRKFIKDSHTMDNSEDFKKWVFTYCLRGIKNNDF